MAIPPAPLDQPTIKFRYLATLRGALLDLPLILVERDDLQRSQRFDEALPYTVDLDRRAVPGDDTTYMGPWRACTPNRAVDVEVTAGQPGGTVYVNCSADGSTVADSCGPANVPQDEPHVLRFTPTLPFYRVGIAPAVPCRVRVLSQQRGA